MYPIRGSATEGFNSVFITKHKDKGKYRQHHCSKLQTSTRQLVPNPKTAHCSQAKTRGGDTHTTKVWAKAGDQSYVVVAVLTGEMPNNFTMY